MKACVAQRIEHLTTDQKVGSSSLSGRANVFKSLGEVAAKGARHCLPSVYHRSRDPRLESSPESEVPEREVVKTITALAPLWVALIPSEQARVLRLLVEPSAAAR